ncbi:hypothetical protein NA57DRAFT_75542 [Rhizodiscina lignyota]|uniref:Uncharacterized protein n=1 Tax=Rhizodiscina lignyota TaxID=1504668 RepID=A0A9P4IIR3_9PEZI|nr:hypothetical protein NA57DRAFT_75542 [Rhizodiscina lignyota]
MAQTPLWANFESCFESIKHDHQCVKKLLRERESQILKLEEHILKLEEQLIRVVSLCSDASLKSEIRCLEVLVKEKKAELEQQEAERHTQAETIEDLRLELNEREEEVRSLREDIKKLREENRVFREDYEVRVTVRANNNALRNRVAELEHQLSRYASQSNDRQQSQQAPLIKKRRLDEDSPDVDDPFSSSFSLIMDTERPSVELDHPGREPNGHTAKNRILLLSPIITPLSNSSLPTRSPALEALQTPETNAGSPTPVISQRINPNTLYTPTRRGTWWYRTEAVLNAMSKSKRRRFSHIGRIMETELGEKLEGDERCTNCVTQGFECWRYSEAGVEQIPWPGAQCARCRHASQQGTYLGGCSLTNRKPVKPRQKDNQSPTTHNLASES